MRFALATVAVAALVGSAAAANAAPPPLVGVSQGDDGSVCVTVSYQVPHCTPGTGVTR